MYDYSKLIVAFGLGVCIAFIPLSLETSRLHKELRLALKDKSTIERELRKKAEAALAEADAYKEKAYKVLYKASSDIAASNERVRQLNEKLREANNIKCLDPNSVGLLNAALSSTAPGVTDKGGTVTANTGNYAGSVEVASWAATVIEKYNTCAVRLNAIVDLYGNQ